MFQALTTHRFLSPLAPRMGGFFLVVALVSQSHPTMAWWDLGHAALCETSLAQVKPETRAQIESLLTVRAPETLLEPESFGQACTWADRIKSLRKDTSPWHYLNAPPGTLTIADVAHPEHGDILDALINQMEILGNTSASDIDRAEALRWVGHLVGDLHQPMHLGYESDWGGNKYSLSLSPSMKTLLHENKRDKTNMHAVWDGYLLIYAAGRAGAPLRLLLSESSEQSTTTQPDSNTTTECSAMIEQWAEQSLLILNRPEVQYATKNRLKSLSETYLEKNREHAIAQLSSGAAHLALLLDQLLASH